MAADENFQVFFPVYRRVRSEETTLTQSGRGTGPAVTFLGSGHPEPQGLLVQGLQVKNCRHGRSR